MWNLSYLKICARRVLLFFYCYYNLMVVMIASLKLRGCKTCKIKEERRRLCWSWGRRMGDCQRGNKRHRWHIHRWGRKLGWERRYHIRKSWGAIWGCFNRGATAHSKWNRLTLFSISTSCLSLTAADGYDMYNLQCTKSYYSSIIARLNYQPFLLQMIYSSWHFELMNSWRLNTCWTIADMSI